ncbi:hypothetical protein MLD38_026857 [Melastoma candidum]|uniref:Uncharacterized protein n=1 Tax=Melastoma candidum TaxID=119954 RepID=A0ACB9NZW6_9MYRT|nr:hypothetical protein MLD38_026857 [Melastoma candidum]
MKRKRKTTTKADGRPSPPEHPNRSLRGTNGQHQSPAIFTTAPRRSSCPNPNPQLRNAGESGGGRVVGKRNGAGRIGRGRKKKRKQLKHVLRKSPEEEEEGEKKVEEVEEEEEGKEKVGELEEEEEDPLESSTKKKRRIEEIAGIAAGDEAEEEEKKTVSASMAVVGTARQESHLDCGLSKPLPDKKILLYILDRLQRKDTYGVFSEPVNPEELPDYDEVIEHPMDFGTVRKKLDSGAYLNLEQFEKDISLISSNAMQYNAQSTIYFRQARAIEELAKKNFEELRQCGDGSGNTFKIIRRGRPPKHLKTVGEPAVNGAGLRPSSHATLATGGANTISMSCDRRNADIYGSTNSFGRLCHGPRSNDIYASTFLEKRFDRSDEYTSSHQKGFSVRPGKMQVVLGDSRRCTYGQFDPSACGREAFLFAFFRRDRKQFVPVGLQAPHGYARSLARFAANLGPVAWKVASSKIQKSLPAGVNFGPGWVGQDDIVRPKLGGEFPVSPGTCDPRTSASGTDQVVTAAAEHSDGVESQEPQAEEIQSNRATDSPSDLVVLNSSSCIVPASSLVHAQLKFMRSGVNGVNDLVRSGLAANVRQLVGSGAMSGSIPTAESGDPGPDNPVAGDSTEYNPLPDAVAATSGHGS